MNIDLLVERLNHLKTNEGYGQPEAGLEFQHNYFGTYHLVLNPQHNNIFKTAIDKQAKDNDKCGKGLSVEKLVEMLIFDTGKWTPYNEEILRAKKQKEFEIFLSNHNLTVSTFESAMNLYHEGRVND